MTTTHYATLTPAAFSRLVAYADQHGITHGAAALRAIAAVVPGFKLEAGHEKPAAGARKPAGPGPQQVAMHLTAAQVEALRDAGWSQGREKLALMTPVTAGITKLTATQRQEA